MRDDRVLKEVFTTLAELESYMVTYRTDEGKYCMNVWAEDGDDAKREVLMRVKEAKVMDVERGEYKR